MRRCLQKHMKVIQFVYSRFFPEIYSLIDKRGINLKNEFLLTFKAWKDKKKFSQPSNDKKPYGKIEQQCLEKTLIEDENVTKELNEKKLKRKVLAEKNTGLKEAAKKRRKTATKNELWDCIDTLNNKSVQTKEQKQNKSKNNLIV